MVENMSFLGVTISYEMAWHSEQKAIDMAYGNQETLYTLLPRLMSTLQASNPGIVVEWKHTEYNIGDYKIFNFVFWKSNHILMVSIIIRL